MNHAHIVDNAFPARRKVYDALMALIDESSLADLSVGMVYERAGISRATFYRHFDNLNDVILKYLRDVTKDAMASARHGHGWPQFTLILCERIYENRDFFSRIVYKCSECPITDFGQRHLRKYFIELIQRHYPKELDEELLFEIEVSSICEPIMLVQWVKSGMKSSPAEITSNINAALPERLFNLIYNASI